MSQKVSSLHLIGIWFFLHIFQLAWILIPGSGRLPIVSNVTGDSLAYFSHYQSFQILKNVDYVSLKLYLVKSIFCSYNYNFWNINVSIAFGESKFICNYCYRFWNFQFDEINLFAGPSTQWAWRGSVVSKVFGIRVIVKCGKFVQNVSIIKFNINLRSPVSGLTETPEWIQVIMMMVKVPVMVMDWWWWWWW